MTNSNPKTITFPVPLEEDDSITFSQFLTLHRLKHTHINNEMWSPSRNQHRKAKAMGVSSGVPDYMIVIKRTQSKQNKAHLLFVEMKREKGGVVSPKQQEWIDLLNQVDNVEARVAEGFKEATKIINELIN